MSRKNPHHPGLTLRHDCLEPLKLSVAKTAELTGISRKKLSDVVNCRSGITPEMSILLGNAFGFGPDMLYRLQCAYDLAQAKKNIGEIKVRRIRTKPVVGELPHTG